MEKYLQCVLKERFSSQVDKTLGTIESDWREYVVICVGNNNSLDNVFISKLFMVFAHFVSEIQGERIYFQVLRPIFSN